MGRKREGVRQEKGRGKMNKMCERRVRGRRGSGWKSKVG